MTDMEIFSGILIQACEMWDSPKYDTGDVANFLMGAIDAYIQDNGGTSVLKNYNWQDIG